MSDERDRPVWRHVLADLGDWCRFHGPARIAGLVAGATVALVAGLWLLRAPAPPVESRIARTSATTFPGDLVAGTASLPLVAESFSEDVTVHVAGAVRRPGVYTLALTSRVVDAVTAAGGATPRAQLDAVNLARPLTDGEQVYIPRRGQSATSPAATTSRRSGTGDSSAATSTAPVNVNTADEAALQTLPGIGPTIAQAIIDHRQRRGPFTSIDGLLEVKGIGPAKLAAMRSRVTV